MDEEKNNWNSKEPKTNYLFAIFLNTNFIYQKQEDGAEGETSLNLWKHI